MLSNDIFSSIERERNKLKQVINVVTHCGKFLNVLIRRSQRSQTDLLRELSELWIGQQRHMTQQLMTRVTESKHEQKQARYHEFRPLNRTDISFISSHKQGDKLCSDKLNQGQSVSSLCFKSLVSDLDFLVVYLDPLQWDSGDLTASM